MNASNAVIFEGATADAHETTLSTVDATADRTINLPNQSGTLPVLAAASATAITSTPEELNKLDGATVTVGEINLIDGDATVGTTAFADGDGLLHNDNGTMRVTSATTLKTYMMAGTLTTAAQTNITSLGTLTALAVDNFVIDGTTIELTTGDIILDSAGGKLQLSADGTSYFKIIHSSGDTIFKPQINGKDLLFHQYDGTLVATVQDSGSFDVAGALNTAAINAGGVVTANAGVVVDNFTLDGTTLALSSGDLTVDVAGNIILDADTAYVYLADAGTNIGLFKLSSSDFYIKSVVSDKDIIFQGNDGGSGITALTLDMSAAGAATFNNDVTAFSDARLKDNIETIPNALETVCAMRGVNFTRNDNNDQPGTGVIAQEMQEVFPVVVKENDDENNTLSVSYGNLVGVLIESIKELKAEIDELKGN